MTRNQRIVGISFPKLLLEELDTVRADIPRSRYIARLLAYLIEHFFIDLLFKL